MKGKRVNWKLIIVWLGGIALAVILGIVLIPQVANEVKRNLNANKNSPNQVTSANEKGDWNKKSGEVVKISIDEWIGYKPLLDANKGLKTKVESEMQKRGLNVEFIVMNDANASSAALIKGDLAGAGYTVNRYAYLQNKFKEADVKVVMPFISNYSNGGDGIISKGNIKSIEDLAGKKIAYPRFSESQTLVEWLIRNSNLSKEAQDQIRASMVPFDTPDQTAQAFFAGSVDAAATWEPFLTQARATADTRVLFDTSMSTNLILSGIVFRQDFLDANPGFMSKFIDAVLEVNSKYTTDFENIRQMPMFELMDESEIKDMALGADLTTWKNNKTLLTDQAVTMYKDMAEIWKVIGETAYPEMAQTAFTDKYINELEGKYSSVVDQDKKEKFTKENKEAVANIENKDALMKKTLDIKFQPDSAVIMEESYEALNDFAETAKILDGVFIQVEGNTAKVSNSDGKDFSLKRANSVAKYLQAKGVDGSRFIVVGNGDTNPVGSNDTDEGRALNRRTDVLFKVLGY